jgi:hypothetical protein
MFGDKLRWSIKLCCETNVNGTNNRNGNLGSVITQFLNKEYGLKI